MPTELPGIDLLHSVTRLRSATCDPLQTQTTGSPTSVDQQASVSWFLIDSPLYINTRGYSSMCSPTMRSAVAAMTISDFCF